MWCVCAICIYSYGPTLAEFYEYIDKESFMKPLKIFYGDTLCMLPNRVK